METKKSNYLSLVDLFNQFIKESANGKRLQKNGKVVLSSTIQNYKAVLQNLLKFQVIKDSELMVNINYRYSKRQFNREKRAYKRFYKQFSDYLYAKGCTDNYAGMLFKNIRSFFIYLNQSKGYQTGDFYKEFYVRREDIPVVVLSREQLQFLISNKSFENSLPPHLITAKNIFVLGCTVGLRFSDLMALKKKNLEVRESGYYISTHSAKTNAFTRIKLPVYAVEILQKYKNMQRTLLPTISLNQFNKNLKRIAELAGWTSDIGKERSKRGVKKELKNKIGKTYRFCDMMSSHVMRRTAITTLLIHGMPETLVRKISGHAANSKEFYKYVKYSETYMDQATDRVFERILGNAEQAI